MGVGARCGAKVAGSGSRTQIPRRPGALPLRQPCEKLSGPRVSLLRTGHGAPFPLGRSKINARRPGAQPSPKRGKLATIGIPNGGQEWCDLKESNLHCPGRIRQSSPLNEGRESGGPLTRAGLEPERPYRGLCNDGPSVASGGQEDGCRATG